MLTIAGGIGLGFFALAVIGAILGVIAENIEEIAAGCVLLSGVAAVVGVWAFLDDQWPEIDWVKTALAVICCAFIGWIAIAALLSSELISRLLGKKADDLPLDNGSLATQRDFEKAQKSGTDEVCAPAQAVQLLEDIVEEAAEPQREETEDEWRRRVARELRLSRLPKPPSKSAIVSRGQEFDEFFQAYLKWKDKPSDNS